jgi:hypothetical protein
MNCTVMSSQTDSTCISTAGSSRTTKTMVATGLDTKLGSYSAINKRIINDDIVHSDFKL